MLDPKEAKEERTLVSLMAAIISTQGIDTPLAVNVAYTIYDRVRAVQDDRKLKELEEETRYGRRRY